MLQGTLTDHSILLVTYIGSVQAQLKVPFEFDFLSQSFPALCLRLLPKQPTLSGGQLIENPNCCPVGLPNESHFGLLQQLVKQRLEQYDVEHACASERRDLQEILQTQGSTREETDESIDHSSYYDHLTRAFEVWSSAPEADRNSLWHLETFRAFGWAQEEAIKLKESLTQAEAQTAHLQLQIARLNLCQQPKEFTYNIPANYNVTPGAVQTLSKAKADTPLDRENLITKWTAIVKEDRKFQRSLPELELQDLSIPGVDMMEDLQKADANGQKGARGEANEDDDVDAAGEDDDELASHTNGINGIALAASSHRGKSNIASLGRDVLDPNLRNHGEGVMEVDGGDFGAEMLLADMRARASKARGAGS